MTEDQTPSLEETTDASATPVGDAADKEESGAVPATARVEANILAIQRVTKQLKGPSTISFADRQALTRKLNGALEALQSLGDDATEEEANEALAKAETALRAVGIAQPASARAAGGKGKGGGGGRSGGGGFAQQRSPMRIGGE